MVAGRNSGAARRLQERRLCAMAVAVATHHSAQLDGAPRSQTAATRAREVEAHDCGTVGWVGRSSLPVWWSAFAGACRHGVGAAHDDATI